jgi:hypothetical protein
MNTVEWLDCVFPEEMLDLLAVLRQDGKVSDRKRESLLDRIRPHPGRRI